MRQAVEDPRCGRCDAAEVVLVDGDSSKREMDVLLGLVWCTANVTQLSRGPKSGVSGSVMASLVDATEDSDPVVQLRRNLPRLLPVSASV